MLRALCFCFVKNYIRRQLLLAKGQEADTKGHVACDPIYAKRPRGKPTDSGVCGCQGLGEGMGFFWGSWNVLDLVVMVAQHCEYTKTY